MASRPVLPARLSLPGDGGGEQRDKPTLFASELFPAQSKGAGSCGSAAAVEKDAPPRRGGPQHALALAARPERKILAGGAAFRAAGRPRSLTPGTPPHPADSGGEARKGKFPRGRGNRGGRHFVYRPGWTVFHLPSTPGPREPSDRERAAGSDPAEPSGSVEWAGVRLNLSAQSRSRELRRRGQPVPGGAVPAVSQPSPSPATWW